MPTFCSSCAGWVFGASGLDLGALGAIADAIAGVARYLRWSWPGHLRNICRTTFCPSLQPFPLARIGETCSFLVSDPASLRQHYLLAAWNARHCDLKFLQRQPKFRQALAYLQS